MAIEDLWYNANRVLVEHRWCDVMLVCGIIKSMKYMRVCNQWNPYIDYKPNNQLLIKKIDVLSEIVSIIDSFGDMSVKIKKILRQLY